MGDTPSSSSSVTLTITSTITGVSISYPISTIYYTDNRGVTTSSRVLTASIGPELVTLTTTIPASAALTSSISGQPSTPISVSTTTPTSVTTAAPATSVSSTSTSSTSTPLASTPASTNSGSSHHSKTGLGGGAVAGIAIASLVAGLLIAGLLTWIFMSNRQKKHRSSGGGFARERHRSSRAGDEKALPLVSVAEAGAVGNWEKHLDQPEGDGTITRSVKGLFDHIEVHVENFYRDSQVIITQELETALLRVDSRRLPDSVIGLLPQTERPTMLIKHCIAQSIVEHISTDSKVQDSFLPTDFIALPQALTTSHTTASKPVYNQAYSRWRVLSSYLRPKPTEDPTYTATRDMHIAALADTLCQTFDPWAMSRENLTSRRENLINIMKSASETGMLLFSQPSTFKWRWSSPGGKSGRLRVVLLPGLDKTRDENANELQRPLELVKPVTGVIVG